MTRTLLIAFFGIIVGAPPAQQDVVFRSAPCHVSFRYPAGWRVQADTSFREQSCVFLIRPQAWDSLLIVADSVSGAYTVWLEVLEGGLASNLSAGPFEPRENGWVVLGRHGIESPAVRITDRDWSGLRGTAADGCYRIEGGYVGICELEIALIGTAEYTAELQSRGDALEVFETILATLDLR